MKTETTKYTKIADDLYLVRQKVASSAPAAPAELPTHHVMVVDCSGSMSSDLPQLRAQLKKKHRTLVRDGDALSIVWFSGRGEYGALFECERLPTLVDLKSVETTVDRWLKPIGLTGFKEPIEEVSRLVERARHDYSSHSLVFMSDGCDNQWPRAEVLRAVEAAAGGLSAATFVEYGYCADRALLAQMAERAGGQHIFAESFDRYEPIVEAALRQRPTGQKRVLVKVEGDPVGGFVWTVNLDACELTSYGVEGGEVRVPDVGGLVFAYLSTSAVGQPVTGKESKSPAHMYAALSLFGVRARPDVVLPILRRVGDVSFVREFGGLFGKQRYSAFETRARAAAFDASLRFTEGEDFNAVPRDDAYTVLEFLRLLTTDKECRVLLDHPRFEYNRIGRKRVDPAGDDALRFVATPMPEGCSVSGLTYNEDKPNVSILVRREGTVDLSGHLQPNVLVTLPRDFPTFIFRNYAIVKDGVVHVKTLPVRLSEGALRQLMAESDAGRLPTGVVEGTGDAGLILAHLDKLPVLSRRVVSAQTARLLFECEWALTKVQAAQKVYRSILKEVGALKKSESFEQLYGATPAEWLKDAGFTDYSGFNPSKVQTESTDHYVARELSVKLKGFASLPSLNEFRKQRDKGKLNGPASLMLPAFEEATAYAKGRSVKDLETWLESRADSLDVVRRSLLADKAQAVFAIVVGGVWFSDLPTVGEGAMTLTLDGAAGDRRELEFSVQAREVEVKV